MCTSTVHTLNMIYFLMDSHIPAGNDFFKLQLDGCLDCINFCWDKILAFEQLLRLDTIRLVCCGVWLTDLVGLC